MINVTPRQAEELWWLLCHRQYETPEWRAEKNASRSRVRVVGLGRMEVGDGRGG
jgi:hypothetical protein